ncbi:MAG: sensor histidine kinase, partial [Anaerolineae bacterium]
MKPVQTLGRSLGWKLLFSYLLIILVALVVLTGTAFLHTGTAIAHHVADMQAALQGGPDQTLDLEASFHAAINEVIAVATAAAIAAAVVVSAFATGRIVGPLRAMIQVSHRIAGGDYHQRVQVVSQDELGDLAISFNRMAEALEQTEQRRLELIGNVAHELRTPLSSVRGTMEGLIDGVLPREPVTFLSVQREVARLQRLVHDLEELSRAEAGQVSLSRHLADVGALVAQAAERLLPQIQDKGVALRVDLPGDLPSVFIDAGRITQVLLNLLGNALQYTPSGGQVIVAARVDQQALQLSVKDSGIGISAGDLLHVFERFYRV